jgi:hypothetical protein
LPLSVPDKPQLAPADQLFAYVFWLHTILCDRWTQDHRGARGAPVTFVTVSQWSYRGQRIKLTSSQAGSKVAGTVSVALPHKPRVALQTLRTGALLLS